MSRRRTLRLGYVGTDEGAVKTVKKVEKEVVGSSRRIAKSTDKMAERTHKASKKMKSIWAICL